jgi:hypothetical protein
LLPTIIYLQVIIQSVLRRGKMTQHPNNQPTQKASEEFVYEAPAIVYEGVLSTRAGSPIPPDPGAGLFGADSSDLFGE